MVGYLHPYYCVMKFLREDRMKSTVNVKKIDVRGVFLCSYSANSSRIYFVRQKRFEHHRDICPEIVVDHLAP